MARTFAAVMKKTCYIKYSNFFYSNFHCSKELTKLAYTDRCLQSSLNHQIFIII